MKHLVSRILCCSLAAVTASAAALCAMPVSAAQSAVQFNNIILFAQFQPLSEGNFVGQRLTELEALCNDESSLHSLTGYVDAVSYGQLHVTSYFPQLQNGVITPYVLSQSADQYANAAQYALEMVQNIPVPEDIPLDGNGDGIVDNIILVIDGKAEETESPIWPKAFSGSGLTMGGLAVDRMNIQNSYKLFDDIITGQEAVLCHEFMHSLGYPDLYRHGREGVAVGMWDIMASNSVFLQYPLAYQRMAVSGWLDAKDITTDGTYTLSPASASEGDRLYLLKTPLSDTEFFAVEYRQQGAKYSKELDVKIYGSGMVVYRVNTEIDGNYKENADGIYVFRPGETELDAGAGDMTASCYGGAAAPDHIGSADWSAGVADGALVYSNGTNSGITLSDITMDGDTLTFTAAFADRTDVQLWESLDPSVLSGMTPQKLAAAPDGAVYLLAAGVGKAGLFRVDGKKLAPVGAALSSGSVTGMNQPKLTFCGNTPYLLYHDTGFLLHLCALQNDAWVEVWKGSALAQYADMAVDGDKLYLAYTTGSFPYVLEAACFDTHTKTCVSIGQKLADNACNLSAAVSDGVLFIGYRDIRDGNTPKLTCFDGTTWTTEAFSQQDCGSVAISAGNDGLLIAPSGKGNAVYTYENGVFTAYPLPDATAEHAFVQLPLTGGNAAYVAVNEQNPDVLTLYRLHDSEWQPVGDPLANSVVNEPSFVYSMGTIYAAFSTINGTPVIKCLKAEAEPQIVGDVNRDGACTIADAVMLQKWLLHSGTLTDWTAADLDRNGMLTAVDLTLLKRLLTT